MVRIGVSWPENQGTEGVTPGQSPKAGEPGAQRTEKVGVPAKAQ